MKKQKHLDWISTVIVTCLLIAGLSNGATNSQAAEKYPSRPIQVLIGFEPGSPDAVLRVFTDKITKILGQPVNFVFKPGATGTIAVSYVASSKPDGYTLVTGGPGPFVTAHSRSRGSPTPSMI